MEDASRMVTWRRSMVANGRCPDCGGTTQQGRRRCADCLERNRERMRRLRGPRNAQSRLDLLADEEAAASVPRCRCGLMLPCDDCLPTTAAEFARVRMVGQSQLERGRE